MIFPLRLETAPVLQRLSARRLAHENKAAGVSSSLAVRPVPGLLPTQKRYPKASFSAQLLALGLRYGMDDLVNKADAEIAPAPSDVAAQHYALAQDNFMHDARPALFARWSA